MHRTVRGVIVAAVTLAACGGGGSEPDTIETGSDVSRTVAASTDPDSSTPSTNSPNETNGTETVGTESNGTETNGSSPDIVGNGDGTTAAGDDGLTAIEPAETDEIDPASVALLNSALYTIPNAQTHCESGSDLYSTYVFPAEGGDLYAVCVSPGGAYDPLPATLTISAPDGTVVTAVTVLRGNPLADDTRFDDGFELILEYRSGARRFGGIEIRFGPNIGHVQMPILLPHDRPAGDWTIGWKSNELNSTATMPIARPCASSSRSASELGDPTRFDPAVRFSRQPPVPSGSCRGFPDVIGQSAVDARSAIEQHIKIQGGRADIRVSEGCGGDIVTKTDPVAGDFRVRAIDGNSSPSPFGVQIDVGDACSIAPDLTGLPFAQARSELENLEAANTDFSWTADPTCRDGSTVDAQDPPAGDLTSTFAITACVGANENDSPGENDGEPDNTPPVDGSDPEPDDDSSTDGSSDG